MHITEENFVSSLANGNEQAIEYIIKQYGWVIKTVLRKHLYNLSQYEEECMNDVLLAVWNNIDRFDENKSTFKNWLAGVSKFTALNYVRKYKRDLQLEPLEDVIIIDKETPYELITKEEIGKDFEEMLSCLKEEDQTLFIKLYIEEKSIQEISNTTGIKKEVIYNRVSRAKTKIKRLFTHKGGRWNG